jgi:hypothetical protein
VACCGQTVTSHLTITQKDIDEGLGLLLEYNGGRTVTVTGTVTYRTYIFSGLQRRVKVDPRDATAILRDHRFRLKGIVRQNDSLHQS